MPFNDFKVTSIIHIRRRNIFQCLVIPIVVVIIHKDANLILKLRGTVIILLKRYNASVCLYAIGSIGNLYTIDIRCNTL
jgi:hypothetical protein